MDAHAKCPFLEEVAMLYCRAFPIRKPIPAKSISGPTPCLSHSHADCPLFVDSARTPERHRMPAPTQPREKKECVWLKSNIVSYRLCTRNYDCERCSFAQTLSERNGKYVEPREVREEVAHLRELPAAQRVCKYVLIGRAQTQPCTNSYECWSCPTYQSIHEKLSPAGVGQ